MFVSSEGLGIVQLGAMPCYKSNGTHARDSPGLESMVQSWPEKGRVGYWRMHRECTRTHPWIRDERTPQSPWSLKKIQMISVWEFLPCSRLSLPIPLSVCQSVCLSVRLSVSLSFYLSDILLLLTFWTTFVLTPKLKSGSVFLSVCQSVFRHIFLTFWHPVDILNNFGFDKKAEKLKQKNCTSSPALDIRTYRAAGQPKNESTQNLTQHPTPITRELENSCAKSPS